MTLINCPPQARQWISFQRGIRFTNAKRQPFMMDTLQKMKRHLKHKDVQPYLNAYESAVLSRRANTPNAVDLDYKTTAKLAAMARNVVRKSEASNMLREPSKCPVLAYQWGRVQRHTRSSDAAHKPTVNVKMQAYRRYLQHDNFQPFCKAFENAVVTKRQKQPAAKYLNRNDEERLTRVITRLLNAEASRKQC
eukprot:4973468-Pleurochrysis_carterae.AAC.1